MANWKLGKIQYGFLETATSGGTLTLVSSSKQYQVLTGTMNHNVKLPNATTIGVGVGVGFAISNQSTGIITIQLNDNSVFDYIASGQSVKIILTDAGTSNGVWRVTSAGGGSGGIASINPGSTITTDYVITSNDNGRVLNVDTSSAPIIVTLPAPEAGFKITIKDFKGNAFTNNITIERDSNTEEIDGVTFDDKISTNYTAVSLVSDGTDWYRILSFTGNTPSTGGLGVFGGGYSPSPTSVNTIDYVTIATLGNATDFGDLTVARHSLASCASSTRGLFAGGNDPSYSNVIDYITIASASNAIDFGDLTVARTGVAGCSSSIRGLFMSGYNGSPSNVIDYVTIATTGNAIDFGDLTGTKFETASCSSSTRGINGGGDGSLTAIDYVTIASLGNATSFGNLTVGRGQLTACSNSTRGLFAGGAGFTNVIDYITIATTGNAIDFGDLTVGRSQLSACSSSTRALFGGGYTGTESNVIDYVTIASLGNATDFGDLTQQRGFLTGLSNAHGGL